MDEIDSIERRTLWRRLTDWFHAPSRPVSLGELDERSSPPGLPRAHPSPPPAHRPAEGRPVEITDALAALTDRLALEEVEPEVAKKLLEAVIRQLSRKGLEDPVEVFMAAARILMAWCPIEGSLRVQPGVQTVVALVGPTGVGKTTMLARLASIAAHRDKLRVGLMTADTWRIGAVDQLRAYAQLLQLPCEVVKNREGLAATLERFSGFDLVFMDTAGQSPNDLERLQELSDLVGSDQRIHRFLVMSATTKHSDARDVIEQFRPVGYEALILNKLDESRTHGILLNAPLLAGCPLAFLGVGQQVPRDLEVATPERVADLILNLSQRFGKGA